jgi:antirestriction protein ArdC
MRFNCQQSDSQNQRRDVCAEITDKIIKQIEAGTIPWVQPWAGGSTLPRNCLTRNNYSGINILLLWDALFTGSYAVNQWLTFKQALAMGGNVRKGEKGTTVVYADNFTPKGQAEAANASGEDGPRRVWFLKRFTVFNVAQCEGLPPSVATAPVVSRREPVAAAEELIAASGARFEVGGGHAYYQPSTDTIRVPPQEQFFEPINYYRTALHELTHNAESRFMPHRALAA